MTRKYVLLFWHYITERDFIRFGHNDFSRRGYQVQFVSCWNAIYGGRKNVGGNGEFQNHPDALIPQSRAELERLLDTLEPTDFILMTVPMQPETTWIFQALSRRGLPYSTMWLSKYPSNFPYRFGSLKEAWRSLHTFMVLTRRFFQRLGERLTLIMSEGLSYFSLKGPQFHIEAGQYRLWLYPYVPKLRHSTPIHVGSFELLWAHHGDDWDGMNSDKPYALFLDEAMSHHPDWTIEGGQPENMPAINADIRRSLDKIERDIGLPIVIALHPKSDYSQESFAEVYGNRTSVKNRTAALIRKATFVIGHASTSFTIAVIFDRPTVFLTNRYIRNSRDGLYVDYLAAWCGVAPIEMEDFNRDDAPPMHMPTASLKHYDQFKRKFVAAPGAHEGDIWDYVAECFETESSSPPPSPGYTLMSPSALQDSDR